jgi:hypothetical protein
MIPYCVVGGARDPNEARNLLPAGIDIRRGRASLPRSSLAPGTAAPG